MGMNTRLYPPDMESSMIPGPRLISPFSAPFIANDHAQRMRSHTNMDTLAECVDIKNANGGIGESIPGFLRSKCREVKRLEEDNERLQHQIADLQAADPEQVARDAFKGDIIDEIKNVGGLLAQLRIRLDDDKRQILNELTSLRAKLERGLNLTITAGAYGDE